MKDTEGNVEGQDPRRGELQLVVEQRTVGENPLLDAGLHRALKNKVQGSEPTRQTGFYCSVRQEAKQLLLRFLAKQGYRSFLWQKQICIFLS